MAAIDALEESCKLEHTAKKDFKREPKTVGETISAQTLDKFTIKSNPCSQCTSTQKCNPQEKILNLRNTTGFEVRLLQRKTDHMKLQLEESMFQNGKARHKVGWCMLIAFMGFRKGGSRWTRNGCHSM